MAMPVDPRLSRKIALAEELYTALKNLAARDLARNIYERKPNGAELLAAIEVLDKAGWRDGDGESDNESV
jgi:hypothetical protein